MPVENSANASDITKNQLETDQPSHGRVRWRVWSRNPPRRSNIGAIVLENDNSSAAEIYEHALRELSEAFAEWSRAKDAAQARLCRSCAELRGEAFHLLMRKDEDLQTRFQAVMDAFERFTEALARRDVARWARTNVSPQVLENLWCSIEHAAGVAGRELDRRAFCEALDRFSDEK